MRKRKLNSFENYKKENFQKEIGWKLMKLHLDFEVIKSL